MSIPNRCPGQDARRLHAAYFSCQCGALVEIFSDEQGMSCPQCHEYVWRDRAPSCWEWCQSARECLGEERWRELAR